MNQLLPFFPVSTSLSPLSCIVAAVRKLLLFTSPPVPDRCATRLAKIEPDVHSAKMFDRPVISLSQFVDPPINKSSPVPPVSFATPPPPISTFVIEHGTLFHRADVMYNLRSSIF